MRTIFAALALACACFAAAAARDGGQWSNADPAIAAWFATLMQPDNPAISCCGEADAYWADETQVKDGKVFAVITDERPDLPLLRHHVPLGTRIEVPARKIKWDRGNPTGHTVVFLTDGNDVLCYVMNGGV